MKPLYNADKDQKSGILINEYSNYPTVCVNQQQQQWHLVVVEKRILTYRIPLCGKNAPIFQGRMS